MHHIKSYISVTVNERENFFQKFESLQKFEGRGHCNLFMNMWDIQHRNQKPKLVPQLSLPKVSQTHI